MLDLNLGLMLFVLVIFFSLLYLLNQILYKPLLKFMEDRDNSIANDLKNAKEMSGTSDELRAKADAILANAKAEANAVREEAVNKAKALADTEIESKTKELDTKYQSFVDELNNNKKELQKSLSTQLPLFKESLKTKIGNL
jgi:F-type H+-transporting ATPase subunit b